MILTHYIISRNKKQVLLIRKLEHKTHTPFKCKDALVLQRHISLTKLCEQNKIFPFGT